MLEVQSKFNPSLAWSARLVPCMLLFPRQRSHVHVQSWGCSGEAAGASRLEAKQLSGQHTGVSGNAVLGERRAPRDPGQTQKAVRNQCVSAWCRGQTTDLDRHVWPFLGRPASVPSRPQAQSCSSSAVLGGLAHSSDCPFYLPSEALSSPPPPLLTSCHVDTPPLAPGTSRRHGGPWLCSRLYPALDCLVCVTKAAFFPPGLYSHSLPAQAQGHVGIRAA